jgi:hypothetical protein
MFSGNIYLAPEVIGKDRVFGHILVEEHVHSRFNKEWSACVLNMVVRFYCSVYSGAKNVGTWLGGGEWDEQLRYEDDWTERIAKQQASKVFPEIR